MALDIVNSSELKNWRIDQWFTDLPKEVRDKLRQFHVELVAFNKSINLISARTESIADQIHFADCLLGSKIILNHCRSNEIYDLGSGNGFPGIILAILAPNYKVVLVESDERKVEFLKHVTNKLNLKNVICLRSRIENLKDNSIAIGVSRGFASVQKSLLVTRKVFQTNAQYFHFKGDGWVSEVAEIPSQMCRYWIPMHIGDYSLPANNTRLSILVTKKIG